MRCICTLLIAGLTLLLTPPATAGEEPIALIDELQKNAKKKLFFQIPEEPKTYRSGKVEYWGAGFDEQGLSEKYAPDAWAAFDLGELEAGRTRVVALMELNDDTRELMEFLEEGDELDFTLAYMDRIEYEWTDVVLDRQESRELVLMEVKTLSYCIPRLEDYTVLWYDAAKPGSVKNRVHLQQDGLSKVSKPLTPGTSIDLNLSPGSLQVLYYPEIEATALPIEIQTRSKGQLVYASLAGKIGLRALGDGETIPEGDKGDRLVPMTIPDDLSSKELWIISAQTSTTFCVLLVPQESPSGIKLKLVVGEPPAAE